MTNDEELDDFGITEAMFEPAPPVLDIDFLLLVVEYVEQNSNKFDDTDLTVSCAIMRTLWNDYDEKGLRSSIDVLQELGYLRLSSTNKTRDQLKLSKNGWRRIHSQRVDLSEHPDTSPEFVMSNLRELIDEAASYCIQRRAVRKSILGFKSKKYAIIADKVSLSDYETHIASITRTMSKGKDVKYLKGGVHGRRQRAGGEGLVQAKYYLTGDLRTALTKAAAANGLSTSNFIQQKLLEDPDIAEFMPNLDGDEPEI